MHKIKELHQTLKPLLKRHHCQATKGHEEQSGLEDSIFGDERESPPKGRRETGVILKRRNKKGGRGRKQGMKNTLISY